MGVKLSDLTTESSPASNDIILIADPTTGLARKITVSALKTFMDGLGGGGDVTAPTIVSIAANTASTVDVVFSESVTVTTAGWSFKRNGTAWSISSVSGSGTTWTFTMAVSGANGETITYSYSQGSGATVDTSSNELANATDASVTNNIPAVGPTIENITWNQLSNTTDSGSGTVTGTNTTTPAGATATKKLIKSNGNYVEYVIGSTVSDSEAVLIALDDNNDADYQWSGGPLDMLLGVYHFSSDYKSANVDGDVAGTSLATAPATSDVVRIEVSGDNLLVKVNGTLKHTETGALTGVTNIYIKAIFAVNSTAKKLELCKGYGLTTI